MEMSLLLSCLEFKYIYIYVYGVKSELNRMQMLSVFLIQAMMTPTICRKNVAVLMDILR